MIIYMVLAVSLFGLGFAGYLAYKIMKMPEGSEEMIAISKAVREGANAYIKRQYGVIAIYFAVVFCILSVMAYFKYVVVFVPFAFLTGGFFSALTGFLGMKIATHANVRTTEASKKSLNSGLRVAFGSGSVMGLCVVGLALLDLAIWYSILNWYYGSYDIARRVEFITQAMLTFGMGASSVALFARVGGGIFTKAADVGADLVGKVEAGIPEDDPRNPAVIADNVGDNVGDVAGMGADLYESYVGAIIATMALAVAAGLGLKGVSVPLSIAATGVFASVIGTFFVKSKEKADQGVLLAALRRGIWISSLIVVITSYFVIKYTIGRMGVYFSLLVGLFAGLIIGFVTEYYTSSKYNPTKRIANSANTGPATVIIEGISVGMKSTFIPILVIALATISSYFLSGGRHNLSLGIYGIGISGVGLLSTLGITLATDAYGPVADNAGGIAEMTKQKPIVRKRTDALDSLGNTTAATGKGFAISSAGLTALALIAAYKDHVHLLGKEITLNVLNPQVTAGLFIGAMLPFLFCSYTLKAVGEAASKIVEEVRRQFKQIKGLMEGKAKPDYARCVSISTRAAQVKMILPSMIAIIAPILTGLVLGIEAVGGLLIGALVSGFTVAVFMANSGGAWDNAKKYIEAGNYGGKGSSQHKAAVVGDTVGDPFKDTSGPSLNILIKLMSMVSLVFAAFIIANTFMP